MYSTKMSFNVARNRYSAITALVCGGLLNSLPSSSAMLEEVLVTGTKRVESASDVPLSVTALSGEKLRNAGIQNLTEMSDFAPNFKLIDTGLQPLIYMRGLGSGGTNQGFELSVGIYSDDIHLGRPYQTQIAFLDVAQVEVLRGPQSIQFGKNSVAGAINISSAKPTEDFEALLTGSHIKPDDSYELTATVSGFLTDTFGARLAIKERIDDGFVYNLTQNRQEPQINTHAARLYLINQPTDDLEIGLKLEHSVKHRNGAYTQIVDYGVLTEADARPKGLNETRDTNENEYADIRNDGVALNISFSMGESSLVSVTGYSGYQNIEVLDGDASRLDSAGIDLAEDYDQFSQELRWLSPTGKTVEYILGLFYQQSEMHYEETASLNIRAGTLANPGLPPLGLGGINLGSEAVLTPLVAADLYRDFGVEMNAVSAFGRATWHISDKWSATLGLRYVDESKKGFRDVQLFEGGTTDPVNPAVGAVFAQMAVEEHQLKGSRSVNSLMHLFTLENHWSDDLLIYFSWATGSKSGGFDARNNNDDTTPDGGGTNFEFDDEIANSLELGIKSSLLDGAAELNIAFYSVEFTDLQVAVFDGALGYFVTNGGEARTSGVEVDGRYLITDSLMLSGSLGYLDFEWLDYTDGPCYFGKEADGSRDGTCDFTGKRNQQTPEYSSSLALRYDGTIDANLSWSATLDASYRSRHFLTGDLDPRGIQASHTKTNLRVALAGKAWEVALFGKNLTNELVGTVGSPAPLDTGGFLLSREKPRTYGLDFRYRFE